MFCLLNISLQTWTRLKYFTFKIELELKHSVVTINVPFIIVSLKLVMDLCDFVRKSIKKNKVVVKQGLGEIQVLLG